MARFDYQSLIAQLSADGFDSGEFVRQLVQRGYQELIDAACKPTSAPPRTSVAEPPFGWIKHVMGLGRFSVRGLTKVPGEWALVCRALNARRLNVVAGAQMAGELGAGPAAIDSIRAGRALDPGAGGRSGPAPASSADNNRRQNIGNAAAGALATFLGRGLLAANLAMRAAK